MRIVRIILMVLISLIALLFWYSALTVPAFAATPYLILALVLTVVTYFVSPFRFRHTK